MLFSGARVDRASACIFYQVQALTKGGHVFFSDASEEQGSGPAHETNKIVAGCMITGPDTRQSSRGQLGRSSHAKIAQNSKM